MEAPELRIEELRAGYPGGIEILRGVSLRVGAGEMVCLLGPNGAGKSTVLRALYGFARTTGGRMLWGGRSIEGLAPGELMDAGIAYVPQLSSVFPDMTVLENLQLGLRRNLPERIGRLLGQFPTLQGKLRQNAGTLSGGERKTLEIARALLNEPRLLLLDEPSAGLSPKSTQETLRLLQDLNKGRGTSILMVEQNARQALRVSHRAYVLELGANRHEGSAMDLLENPQIQRLLLGAAS